MEAGFAAKPLVEAWFGFEAAACRGQRPRSQREKDHGLCWGFRWGVWHPANAPTATLETLGPHWEDNFWTICGLELDGGQARQRRLPGALEGGHEHGVESANCFWMIFGLDVGFAGGCVTDWWKLVSGLGLRPVESSGLVASMRKTIVFSKDSDEALGSPQRLPGRTIFGRFLVSN